MSEHLRSSVYSTARVTNEVQRASELLKRSRVGEASQILAGLKRGHGRDPQVLQLSFEIAMATGNLDAALESLSSALSIAPGELSLHLRKAHVLRLRRRRGDARRALETALPLAGTDPRALTAIGRMFARCDDPLSARACFERARANNAPDPHLLYDLAAAQFFTGEFDPAEANLDALLAQRPQTGHAIYLRSTLRRQRADSNHVADLQARLDAGFTDGTAEAACLYALAKELEDLGQSEPSFQALSRGAGVKRRTLRYDAAAEREAIDAIRRTYTASVMDEGTAGHDDDGPIFIVGMPRTGTTLLERMLGRHPDVRSAGELPDFGESLAEAARRRLAAQPGMTMVEASRSVDFAALGRDYVEGARQAAEGSRRFVDKMPINFMYCGLIRKALPRARILHLVRDPMDACYAIYKTLFNQAYFFSYDLQELAAYYATYHRLMRHWHAVMPGAILDVHYEDLVRDSDGQARRVLDWCGLEWRDAVLAPEGNEQPALTASAAQVREPIYSTSIQKWRRYEAGLEPLRQQLAAAGIVAP